MARALKRINVAAIVCWALVVAMAMHKSLQQKILHRYSVSFFGVLVSAVGLASILTLLGMFPPLHRWVSRHRPHVLLSLAACVATLFIAEVSLRVVKPLGLTYFDDSKRYQLDKIPDPTLVYRNPTSVEHEYFGHTARFNELGLRGPPLHPKAGTFRILALGDSVTQGLAVAESDTWVARIAKLCSSASRGVEALNAGTGGYNTIQEERFLDRHLEELDPDLLVLMFVENDVAPIDVEPGAHGTFAIGALAEQLWLCRVFSVAMLKRHGPLRTVQRDGDWQASFQALHSIAKRCERAHVPLVTFLWRWEVSPKTDALRDDLTKQAQEDGFLFCDVLPWFAGKEIKTMRVSTIDSHPNAVGHEIAADGIAGFLKQHELIRR